MDSRISMITLGVRNLKESVRFYDDGLSFPRHQIDSEDVAFFKLKGSWLALYGREALAKDAGISAKGSGFGGIALAHNVTSREEVDSVLQQAVRAGARLLKAGEEVFWGGYSGYFADPDGYLWEIAHNPHFWIGPEADK